MLEDLKDLERFFKICRKKGVSEITWQGISVKFGDLPNKAVSDAEESDEILTEGLTPEQLMFYAVPNTGQV